MSGQEYINDDWTERVAVDYTYDELGRRTDRDNGLTLNDVLTDYVYNDRGELMSINHEGLYEMDYTHDGGGNPMAIAFSGTNCPAVLDDKTVTYTYDAISRLTNETIPSTSNTTWAYDWVGNRNPATYTYNKADELNPGSGYTYDKLGNLEYKPDSQTTPRTRYYYGGDNLLSQVDDIGQTTNSTYIMWDADGNRVLVARNFVDLWASIYDPTAGIPAALFTMHIAGYNDYTYNVREPGGALLASFEPDGENLHYYHFDALRSTVLVTNGSGTVSDSFAYDAWGNALSGGSGLKPYRYVGQEGYYAHTSTQGTALSDLLQLGVRFYDPEIGRFTQRDPLDVDLSAYIYGSCVPTRLVDPDGNIPELKKNWKECLTNAWNKNCDTTKVSRKMLRCVMWCESKDKTGEVNPKSGTTGLFQIAPEWWDPNNPTYCKHKKWKNRCQDKTSAGEGFNVKNACHNIECGVWLFCKVHKGDPYDFGTTRPKEGKECYDNCMEKYVW